MNVRIWQSALLISVTAYSVVLTGCESREARAKQAFEQYEAAGASGDLLAARGALLSLVSADDKVADYWVELGKVQLQLGDFGSAYNAFQRAHELDRANPLILGFLTQLALRTGNLALAEQSARELELVAPDDPAVRLTHGYVALRQGNLDEAGRQVRVLLATSPNDPSANVLHARILLQSGTPDQAAALLREQVRLQPSDQLSLRALLSIYELREQWTNAAWVARNLLAWQPKDQSVRARLIESQIRAGRAQAALSDTVIGLENAGPRESDLLLAPWIATGNHRMISPGVFKVASKAQGDRRVAMARFLLMADQPEQVVELTRADATSPVTLGNLASNALYGAALAATGQEQSGLERVNAVLELDSANADALRGRAQMRSKAGANKLAIEDAQKLVAADRRSPQARLLLAKIYVKAGQVADARRTLWDAFHDIAAERSIYEALKAFVTKSDDPQALQSLLVEFNDQRNNQMIRSFA